MGIYDDNQLVGIAPFAVRDKTVNFLGVNPVLGEELVSDFGDIIALQEREREVWEVILRGTRDWGLGTSKKIQLNFIREDSPSFKILQELGDEEEQIDVAPYIDLPKTWEEYLLSLGRHNRHELRRKMRKTEEAGVERISDDQGEKIEELFRLMDISHEAKSRFLTPGMKAFFKEITKTFGDLGMLKMEYLRLDQVIIAGVMLFRYKDEYLLYNSGFDPEYSYLAPGFIIKAYAIKDAIEKGARRFDFLRGGERYKYDLGGKERRLYKIVASG